jgi:hypothetical protein
MHVDCCSYHGLERYELPSFLTSNWNSNLHDDIPPGVSLLPTVPCAGPTYSVGCPPLHSIRLIAIHLVGIHLVGVHLMGVYLFYFAQRW